MAQFIGEKFPAILTQFPDEMRLLAVSISPTSTLFEYVG